MGLRRVDAEDVGGLDDGDEVGTFGRRLWVAGVVVVGVVPGLKTGAIHKNAAEAACASAPDPQPSTPVHEHGLE